MLFDIREQKNYTVPAKKLLEELILSIAIEQDGVKLENSKIKSITGDVRVGMFWKYADVTVLNTGWY